MYENFRAGFEEHFPYTPEEILHVWKEATIILDTNVLLNFYRISTNTTDQMFDICKAAQDRLVIPHQVRVEFHRHREKTIAEQVGLFRSVIQDLESISSKFSNSHKRHPTIPLENIASKLKECADDLVKQVRDVQISQPINFISNPDTVLSKLESLLSGCCQRPLSETEMRQLEEFLSTRLEQSIPPCGVPGRDNDKSNPKEQSEHRGDGIVWWQTLQIVAAHKKPLIFVTSDQKANWWRTAKLGNDDKQIGPHTQLIKDVMEKGGSKLLVFTQTQFLEEAPKHFNQVRENAAAVKEVKELEAADWERGLESVNSSNAMMMTRPDYLFLRRILLDVVKSESCQRMARSLPSGMRTLFRSACDRPKMAILIQNRAILEAYEALRQRRVDCTSIVVAVDRRIEELQRRLANPESEEDLDSIELLGDLQKEKQQSQVNLYELEARMDSIVKALIHGILDAPIKPSELNQLRGDMR